MKKLLVLPAMLLCLLLALPLTAFAETCTDAGQNISFSLPEGWTRYTEAESDSKPYVFKKDASEKGTYFSYSKLDLFSTLSAEAQSEYSREDLDNSTFTVEEFKAMFEENLDTISGLEVTKATVAENDFFKATFKQSLGSGSEDVILYAHIFNGYVTYYRYETLEDTVDAAEAESIIETVQFNNETKKNKTKTDAEKEITDTAKEIGSGILGKVIWFVVIGGILVVVRLIVAKKGAKKSQATFENSANQNNVFTAVPAPAEPEAPVQEAPVAQPPAEQYEMPDRPAVNPWEEQPGAYVPQQDTEKTENEE